MANKIAKIPVLENIIKNRHHKIGSSKAQIGHFWSVLQCYICMQKLQISINTLCSLAELVDDRIDAKFRKTDAPINPLMLRKHLHLQATPRQYGHTVVTKTVASGSSTHTKNLIKEVLLNNNSYGDNLHKEICEAFDSGKGQFLSSKATTMGVSDFGAVLSISLVLLDMLKNGFIEDLSSIPNKDHKNYIITKIKEYQKSESETNTIGINIL